MCRNNEVEIVRYRYYVTPVTKIDEKYIMVINKPTSSYTHSTIIHIVLLCVLGISGLTTSADSRASKYTPEGLYDPTIYKLDNGLRVILNPRHGARNVAIRLDVGVGSFDFPCNKLDTAHFLEHLLFTGTTNHTESELDELITQHGGDWNAYTYDESTVYEMDIFSEHTDVALETLSEIISDSVITEENFDLSRTIIYREMGGQPSSIRQFLYKHEIVSTAGHKSRKEILKGSRSYCNTLDTLKDIEFKDILDAYKYYYVPNNMTLVVTGDFDTDSIKKQIQLGFGKLSRKSVERNIPVAEDFNQGPVSYSSSLKPIVGQNSDSGLVYRTRGYDSTDYYVLVVIEKFLSNRLYENIRAQAGLTYAPVAQLIQNRKDGVLHLSAEVSTKHEDKVLKLMHDEVEKLRKGDVTDDDIAKTIKSLLRSWARGLESNSSIADFYIDYLYELDTNESYVDQESHLESITPQDVRTVVERYLVDSRLAYLKNSPTLTYNQFYLLICLTAISLLLLIWHLAKRMHLQIQIIRQTSRKK